METKIGEIVSNMNDDIKKAIITESINSLQNEGLRFSVDTLAKRLKISKKTVYKYFPTKEELAAAVYEYYFEDCHLKIEETKKTQDTNRNIKLLTIYFESGFVICDEIFNKYALNGALQKSAKEKHEKLWAEIAKCLDIKDEIVCKTIIDGAFNELRRTNIKPKKIIEKIEAMLC